jgi:acetyltransferase-like isoleucine patch superfamily enzyme
MNTYARLYGSLATLFVPALLVGAFGSAPLIAGGVTAGTLIENTAVASYDDGAGPRTINSNTVTVRVDELLDVTLTSLDPGPVPARPGDAVLTFELTNQGNGPEAFRLIPNTGYAGNEFEVSLRGIAIDSNNNGTYDDGIDQILAQPQTTAVLAADARLLAELVAGLSNDNAAGEYYLPDVVAAARARGLSAEVVLCDEAETLGINTRAELARAEALFQTRARAAAMEDGVTLTAPETVFFALDTVIGRDAIVGPNVIFGPGVTVESGAEIKGFCHLEGCHISRGASVGPFARLRPGAELAEDVHVGNFVEIKNAVLDEGVKVGHLTYLGDAHVGEHANIGAGTVTCNYDGVMKHRTEIGARAFIGSDTMLVAPVRVGAGALTASGSVITQDVPAEALAVARAAQVNKPGLAARLFEKLRAEKARRAKKE